MNEEIYQKLIMLIAKLDDKHELADFMHKHKIAFKIED